MPSTNPPLSGQYVSFRTIVTDWWVSIRVILDLALFLDPGSKHHVNYCYSHIVLSNIAAIVQATHPMHADLFACIETQMHYLITSTLT